MKTALLYLLATLLSAGICGLESIVLLTTALTALIYVWIAVLIPAAKTQLFTVNDPARHTPDILADAINKALSKALDEQRQIELHIFNPGINKLRIDYNGAGEIIAADSHRHIPIENGEKWIADHVMPLIINSGCRQSLIFNPAQGERAHVHESSQNTERLQPFLLLLPVAFCLLVMEHNSMAAILFTIVFLKVMSSAILPAFAK